MIQKNLNHFFQLINQRINCKSTFAALYTDKWQKVKKKISDKTEDLLEGAEEYYETGKDKASKIVQEGKKKATEIIEDAKKKITTN